MKKLLIGMSWALLTVVLSSLARSAPAPRLKDFEVPPQGGVYPIPMAYGKVTVLHFDSPIRSAIGYRNRHAMTIERGIRSIAIEPEDWFSGVGNLSISVAGVTVGIALYISDSETPIAAAHFHLMGMDEHIKKQAEEISGHTIGALRRECEQRRDYMERVIAARTMQNLADSLRTRFVSAKLSGIQRTDDHVVARLHKITWVGQNACIEFNIENRSGRPYQVSNIALRVRDEIHLGSLSLGTNSANQFKGEVLSGKTERGVMCVPDARRWIGEKVVILIEEASGKRRNLKLRAELKP